MPQYSVKVMLKDQGHIHASNVSVKVMFKDQGHIYMPQT